MVGIAEAAVIDYLLWIYCTASGTEAEVWNKRATVKGSDF
jgi:hypothetical protein